MKYLGFFAMILFFSVHLGAQVNLVPNPGFDSLSSCPNSPGQINFAPPWIDPTAASSDLLNSCSGNTLCSVPGNSQGWQQPYNGTGYSGVVTYVDNSCCINHREYIQSSLISPLQAGKTYCVSFRASWADSVRCVADGLGAYFSSTPVSCAGCFLPYNAQISNPQGNLLNDGNQWEEISGTFVAQGGEQYITIGNFRPDSQTTFQVVNSNAFYIIAYYFIDDVSVTEIAPAIAGINSTICLGDSFQIGSTPNSNVVYSWQPSNDLSDSTIANPFASPLVTTTYTLTQTQCNFTQTATVTVTIDANCQTPEPIIPTLLKGDQMLEITNLESGTHLEVYDLRGRKVFVSEAYHNEFGAFMIAAGTYVIRVTRPNGQVRQEKITVIR